MIGKLYCNLLISFFIVTILIFCCSCFQSSAELTTNVDYSKIFKRATPRINAERETFNCRKNEFACSSRGCIKKSDLCNGIKNCKDGSDETILVCRNFKCPNDSFFRCDYGACIRGSLKCNGRIDCADKSDESSRLCSTKLRSSSFAWTRFQPYDLFSRWSSAATTVKPKPIPKSTCNIPYHPDTISSIELTDKEFKWLNISLIGFKAPMLSKIEILCKSKYALANGERMQESVCQQKGQWNPALKPCQKSCPTLRKDNIDITCYRNGSKVDCNKEMVSGTEVRPVCKPLYLSNPEIHGKLTCLESGEWDRNAPTCFPDCGIPNNPLETLIWRGLPTNASDSPWHVAIYKISAVSRDMNRLLICGGTLISANIVLSAAHCFFDEGRNIALNSSHDYEIVVGKYSRDYKTIDNGYQRTHKIRDIIFTEQGYHPVSTGHHSNDIVVLVLKTPVEISAHVLPACVEWSANYFQPDEGTPGKLVGWGENQNKGEGSEVLLSAVLPFVSYKQCVGKVKELVTDKFCAGTEKGPGARKGDSGGGLMFHIKFKYYVRGIVSTRDANSEKSYATFTDISKHIDWLAKVNANVAAEFSGNKNHSIGVCEVQYGPDRRIEVLDQNGTWLGISSGSKAPQHSTIVITCKPTFALPNGETIQKSVCLLEEKWTPTLQPCLKVCEVLRPLDTVDLSCHREGVEVDCNNTTLIIGTVVRPRCKKFYQMPEGEIHRYRELKCQENGEWNNELFQCVPSCGVPQTELTLPSEFLKINSIPANASDSPWNVGIYKHENDDTHLLCSGTLISPRLVLSASECFTSNSTRTLLEQDYEVVVSKYTSDYNIIDNYYQKNYAIRRFISSNNNNKLILLELATVVDCNKFVLPACIDWESGRTGFLPREGTPGKLVSWSLNMSSTVRNKHSILRHVKLSFAKSCPNPELDRNNVLCATTIANGASHYWSSSYNGAGLLFRDPNTNRYFLRAVSTYPYVVGIYRDISKDILWLKQSYDRLEREYTDVTSILIAPHSNRGCEIPIIPNTKTKINGETLQPSAPGWRVEMFSKIDVTCLPKYSLESGVKTQHSICLQKNQWHPRFKSCLKICQRLDESDSLDLTCYREGLETDCDSTLTPGSIVRPRCKNFFKMQGEVSYGELNCLPNGEWDHELFECEPDCGILFYPGGKSPTNWLSGNYFSPWRVVIYKRQHDGRMEAFCGGTLISAKMVVTAASCFYDRITGKVLNTTSEYEVIVSKYTTDYKMIDNEFQRNYTIREIIFEEENSSSMANIVVLWLKTWVDINQYVLPACIDWNSNTTGLRPAESKSNDSSHRVGIDVSLQVELKSCSAEDTCTKSNTTSTITWAGYHGGGLLFPADSIGSERYFLRGVATRLDVEMVADISNHIDWLKKVRDRVGW